MRTKVLLVPLVALLAVAVLTGCDPSLPGASGPSTEASATPSPSASGAGGGGTTSPTDPATTPHHVGVSASYISIMNADNLAYEVIHPGVSTDGVPVLSAAFGFEPTVTHVAGHEEAVGATVYEWEGFQYRIPDDASSFPPYATWYVRVLTPAVRGIPIVTGATGGIQVGDPMSEAIAEQWAFLDVPADGTFPGFYQAQILSTSIDPVSVGEPAGSDLRMFVGVDGPTGGGGTIISIATPLANWGV